MLVRFGIDGFDLIEFPVSSRLYDCDESEFGEGHEI
jgi:hypothetical protein